MNLLVYTFGKNDTSKRLLDVIMRFAKVENTEIFHSLDSLAKRLRKPKNHVLTVVVHISSKKEFSKIFSIPDFFQDIKLILILPDRHTQTVSQGHLLFPRFVSYVDSDFLDVGAVLRKIVETNLSTTTNNKVAIFKEPSRLEGRINYEL